jgi:hypothetical protein
MMNKVYNENSKGFVVPKSLENTDKLARIVSGQEAYAIHQLMQSTIDAIAKTEPVFIGPEKFGIVDDTDISALALATNVLSLDCTSGGDNRNHVYYTTLNLNGTPAKGAKLKTITAYYRLETVAANAVVISARKKTVGAAVTGAAVAMTGTPAVTKDETHAITMTVTTPEELSGNEYLDILIGIELMNTGVSKIYGVVLDFE